MTPSQASDAKPAQKLLAAHAIKIRIAVWSSLVLTIGAWLAPRTASTALSAPQERPAPLLEEQVQLREVPRPFRGVQDVATRVRDYTVAIRSAEPPAVETQNDFSETTARFHAAGFGVFVSETHILTQALALDGRSSTQLLTADGQTLAAEVAAYEPSSGLVLLHTNTSGSRPVPLASESPDAGTLAVAVGWWEGRDIAVPVFITSVESARYSIGPMNGGVMPGMPVYNVDGELLALAGDGRDGHAFPVRDAADRLIARASAGERLASFGIAFQDLAGLLTGIFGDKGALISDVVAGGPADGAGLQPGDVLLAVGDIDVDSAATATQALSSVQVGTATVLRVQRTARVRAVDVTPVLAYEVAALARAGERPSGPEARTIFPRPLLDRAGVPATARVLSINGRAVSSGAQAQREWRRVRRPVALSLLHDNRRFFAAVEPMP